MSSSSPQRWTFELTPRAYRNLGQLHPDVALACMDYIEFRLVNDPMRMSGYLDREPFAGLRKATPATGYRVVFGADEDARHLVIWRIGPRGTVYRP